jgi:acetyl-CoA carboxylase beta subunit
MALTLDSFKQHIRILALLRRSRLLDQGSYVEAVTRLRHEMRLYFSEDVVEEAFEQVWDSLPADN